MIADDISLRDRQGRPTVLPSRHRPGNIPKIPAECPPSRQLKLYLIHVPLMMYVPLIVTHVRSAKIIIQISSTVLENLKNKMGM